MTDGAGPAVSEVLLVYADAGGGHRNAARALMAALDETQQPWRFRMVNIQQVLAPLDLLHRLSGISIEEAYNRLLRRQWTGLMVPLLRVLHVVIRMRHRALVGRLAEFIAQQQPLPMAVVSVLPNFNAALRDACRRALPEAPFVVVLTDLADFPPHFWIEPGLARVVVASDEAAQQALALGLPPERIARVSGMLLHPRFYSCAAPAARVRVRIELGIPPSAFAVLLLFGGKGSAEMAPLSDKLLHDAADLHVIAVCGENPELAARLEELARNHAQRLHVMGFTDRVADVMAAADILVTKPGPGTLAEAMHQRLPAVVALNRATIPQERFNARFIAQHDLGLVVSNWDEVPACVRRYRADTALQERLRTNLGTLPENRAVYEVVRLIDDELRGAAAQAGGNSAALPD